MRIEKPETARRRDADERRFRFQTAGSPGDTGDGEGVAAHLQRHIQRARDVQELVQTKGWLVLQEEMNGDAQQAWDMMSNHLATDEEVETAHHLAVGARYVQRVIDRIYAHGDDAIEKLKVENDFKRSLHERAAGTPER